MPSEDHTPTTLGDDASLVAGIIAGEGAAFEALYERHRLALFRTALAVARDQNTAEELLQEAFLRAFRHIDRVRLSPGASLRPWLHRILINLAYDWSARKRVTAGPVEGILDRIAATTASPERQLEHRDLERLVGDAIRRLPFKQRIVVILFYLHDMDLQDIANTLELPAGTVKSRLYYGRARLREQLEAEQRFTVQPELKPAHVSA
jgi:RNA polymerase sigma-70 factor (ECF subfamily)